MGICLDTDSKAYGSASSTSTLEAHWVSPGDGVKTMAATNKDDVPNAFVVFVLGGPGSGKITHSSMLTKERNGNMKHISVIDLTTNINDDNKASSLVSTMNPSKLCSTILAEMSESSPGFVISGYPRHPGDVDEWMERVGRIDGVILLDWPLDALEDQVGEGIRQEKLEREQGFDELRLFVRNVDNMTDFFEVRDVLYRIKGDREPDQVYPDFVEAFEKILLAPSKIMKKRPKTAGSFREYRSRNDEDILKTEENINKMENDIIQEGDENEHSAEKHLEKNSEQLDNNDIGINKAINNDINDGDNVDLPRLIWVIGGPGSSKFDRVQNLSSKFENWSVLSVGEMLRVFIERPMVDKDDVDRVKDTSYNGDLVPDSIVVRELVRELEERKGQQGLFVTGFPRTLAQMEQFQRKTGLKPSCVLIDCSELELSANLARRKLRPDDNLAAYKRRLELYRKATLPMLRTLDDQNRLRIVDGDSEAESVHRELGRCLEREVGAFDDDEEKSRKRMVRRYHGLDPNVEDDLQKVIDELQDKGTENIRIKTVV